MHSALKWLLLATIILSGCTGPVAPPGAAARSRTAALGADELKTIDTFERVSPAVVYVTKLAVRRTPFSLNVTKIPAGAGSGFIWNKEGIVVTNFHVVQGAQAVDVTLADRSSYKARPVGFAPDKDLAVLKIEAPASKLKPIEPGDSATLRVGQKVLAIGNPFGFDHTLTTGVISGLDREIESVTRRPITGVIQTDAAINPGNSGGPLLDSSGRLIGVNTSIYSPSGAYAGIGFAVPVDTVKRIIPEILKHGEVRRAGLGVELAADSINRRLGLKGVLVLRVARGSGAAAAGVQGSTRDRFGRVSLGDLIVSIDGKSVTNGDDLYKILDTYQVGQKVALGLVRDKKKLVLEVTLKKL